jgi:hypothetical protein
MLASSDQRNCPAIVIGQKLALSGTNADFFLANTARSLAAAVGRVARARRDDRAGSDLRGSIAWHATVSPTAALLLLELLVAKTMLSTERQTDMCGYRNQEQS